MSDEPGSEASAESTAERAGFRARTYVLLGVAALLAAELVTYGLWGEKAAVRVALGYLPEGRGRDFICFLRAGLTPAQEAACVDALKARFGAVYQDSEEIGPERMIWSKSLTPTLLGFDRGFLWSWVQRRRAWLWFSAEFQYWQSPTVTDTQRATFIWLFGTWVRI